MGRSPSRSSPRADKPVDKSVPRLAQRLAQKLAYPSGEAAIPPKEVRPRTPARLSAGAAPTRSDGKGSPTTQQQLLRTRSSPALSNGSSVRQSAQRREIQTTSPSQAA